MYIFSRKFGGGHFSHLESTGYPKPARYLSGEREKRDKEKENARERKRPGIPKTLHGIMLHVHFPASLEENIFIIWSLLDTQNRLAI